MRHRHILAAENRGSLAKIAALPSLLAFDFDGTLAQFSAWPPQARMRPSTRALFEVLARSRPCAVISGRARADLARHLEGVALSGLVGSHGIEPDGIDPRFAGVIADVRAAIDPWLDPMPGVYIEDKTFTLAIHYRHSPDRAEARTRIYEALAKIGSVRLIGGELVVNVIPKGAPDKGTALLKLVEGMAFGAALYVGDDDTDEDVFRLAGPTELLSIRIGYSATSGAAFFLEHQEEIDLLLQALLECRSAMPAGGERWG